MTTPANKHTTLTDAEVEAINSAPLFAIYSVFATRDPLDPSVDAAEAVRAVEETGSTIRGFYDIGGFRADADLMLWATADDPAKLQAAYHALRTSAVGEYLEPRWSNVATHRPSEFNRAHVPSCFAGFAPLPWVCVYPFVRSYDWYTLPEEDRSRMLREHGIAGREYPEVVASTLASFALGDYEWILAFEAEELTSLVDVMRRQRAVEARKYVREEIPFFTGSRVELAEWVRRQPTL